MPLYITLIAYRSGDVEGFNAGLQEMQKVYGTTSNYSGKRLCGGALAMHALVTRDLTMLEAVLEYADILEWLCFEEFHKISYLKMRDWKIIRIAKKTGYVSMVPFFKNWRPMLPRFILDWKLAFRPRDCSHPPACGC